MRTTPQLITYADRLAGDLRGLHELLTGPLAGAFTGVHVLPFFVPIDGSDAGFDPTDHTAVDPRLGTWDDIARIAADHDVMADLVVNHVSSNSEPFREWVRSGSDSDVDGMFLTLDRVFPDGATEAGLTAVYRPRPGLPLTRIRLDDGNLRLVWTTFTAEQIDIDVDHPRGWAYLMTVIDRLATSGVSMIRLDAVGYAVKRAGTSCFMIPETFEFIDRLTEVLHARGITVLVEVHGHHQVQIDVASHVDLVYDFALPPLVIDALTTGDGAALGRWLRIRPHNAVNVLDTHDGIGVVDVGADPTRPDRPGLLGPERIDALVEGIHRRSRGASRLATGAAASNLDLYQVNCTYYDALGGDDARYLLARLLQCVVPGIPQVYYVGLLAGANDVDLLGRTMVGRDVNRHHYTSDEIHRDLERPVVASLVHLLRWRTACPAFEGTCEILDTADHEVGIRWHGAADSRSSLDVRVDLRAATFEITEHRAYGVRRVTDIDDL